MKQRPSVLVTSKNVDKINATLSFFKRHQQEVEVRSWDCKNIFLPEQPAGPSIENIYNCAEARIRNAIKQGQLADIYVSFENGVLDTFVDNQVTSKDICTVVVFSVLTGRLFRAASDFNLHVEIPMSLIRTVEHIQKPNRYHINIKTPHDAVELIVTGYDKTCGKVMEEKLGLTSGNWMADTHNISRYSQLLTTILKIPFTSLTP